MKTQAIILMAFMLLLTGGLQAQRKNKYGQEIQMYNLRT